MRQASSAAQAYRLFEEGKRPVDVAIELKLRQSEVTTYHEEYLKLIAFSDFFYIYTRVKEDPRPFVRLYNLVKDAGITDQEILRFLTLANDGLSSLQQKYQNLNREFDSLRTRTSNSTIVFQKLTDEISNLYKVKDDVQSSINELEHEKDEKELEKMKLENFVKGFRYNSRGYKKVKKVARQEIESILSDNRKLLEIALRSLIESLHLHPNKFALLCLNMSTMEPPPAKASDDEKLIIDQAKRFHDEMLDKIPDRVVEELIEMEQISISSFQSESA